MKKPKGMVTIVCECGDEILLIPDPKEMGKAIEDHVDLHLQNLKGPGCSAEEAKCLRNVLIAQVFSKGSEIGTENHE